MSVLVTKPAPHFKAQAVMADGSFKEISLSDQKGVVRHQVVNDLPLGRSVDEALRVVQALQFVEKNGEVCPANWKEGARTIKPTVQDSKSFFRAEYAS